MKKGKKAVRKSDSKKRMAFKVVSGQITVSDPCLDIGDLRQGVIDDVKRGEWHGNAQMKGKKVSALVAVHEDYKEAALQWDEGFEEICGSIRVGIFDSNHYQNHDIVKKNMMMDDFDLDRPWCSMCVRVSDPAGAIPYGLVTKVGHAGDFNMPYEIAIEKQRVVGVRIRLDKMK